MAKKGGLSGLGIILAVIGAIILIVFGIIRIANEFVEGLTDLLEFDFDVVGGGNADLVLYSGIIAIVIGIIVLWSWKTDKVSGKESLLIWGIVYLVLGIIGGSLGGLLIIIGGILILLDYFL